MRVYEAISGPYLRWLASARRKGGERVWDLIQDMEAEEADAILSAKGVLPYKESPQAAIAKAAESDDPKIRRILGTLLGIVEFVPVIYAEDAIVEVEVEDEGPDSVVDPRVLTDREAPSIDIDPLS